MDGPRGTVHSATVGPGGPSAVAMDGPGGPIIGGTIRCVTGHSSAVVKVQNEYLPFSTPLPPCCKTSTHLMNKTAHALNTYMHTHTITYTLCHIL